MSTLEKQRRALREGALVQPSPELGTLVVTGKARQSWLNGMVTCDLAPLRSGDGAFGLAVEKTGKVLAELWILLAGDAILIGLLRDRAEMLREHFERHVVMEDVEIEDRSVDHAWVIVYGPLAREASSLLGPRAAVVAAAAVDRTGLGGAAVAAAPTAVPAVVEAILSHAGDLGAETTKEGWRQLHVEVSVPVFGVDYDDRHYPQEAGLERAGVSFTKGCYLGQETVFMLEKRGHVKRRLVRIAAAGPGELPDGAEILDGEGGTTGHLTSIAPEPVAGERLALGYVRFKHAAPGTELRVGDRPARVIA